MTEKEMHSLCCPFLCSTLYLTIQSFNNPADVGHLKTLWEMGENAGNQHFLPFLTMFSTLPKPNFKFSAIFRLSSASAFNFNWPKVLSLENWLIDWLIHCMVCHVRQYFKTIFQLYHSGQCTYHAFLEFL